MNSKLQMYAKRLSFYLSLFFSVDLFQTRLVVFNMAYDVCTFMSCVTLKKVNEWFVVIIFIQQIE